jgi:hypothetical protein
MPVAADTHGVIAAVKFHEAELALDRDVADLAVPARSPRQSQLAITVGAAIAQTALGKETRRAPQQGCLVERQAWARAAGACFKGGTGQTRTRGPTRAHARRGSRRRRACSGP